MGSTVSISRESLLESLSIDLDRPVEDPVPARRDEESSPIVSPEPLPWRLVMLFDDLAAAERYARLVRSHLALEDTRVGPVDWGGLAVDFVFLTPVRAVDEVEERALTFARSLDPGARVASLHGIWS